ncbi:stage III sporulation protein AD [Geosporobacter ferrireducens]|uniref:Stage III sporulation protein AD n=1 Tax=Geosporobacter ferrireducens TaxID=1424294 RepID=A0A1D8GB82_9FIRM|nr:stage III sporulation protein AD [Geosporobacter ferrireducens]AOT68160.1 stage III sporulation protein AD [Geosporobacter ferrireducens]MTI54210.1 stage III sporulation protein AD [Geosporobacter ferrireducens]
MEIFKIVGIGLVATILAILLKQQKPEIAVQISIATGVIIFIFIATRLTVVLEVLNMVAGKIDIDLVYITTIFKIVGIAYVSEFGAQVCRDAGEGAIASKIEFAGKILIMVLAIPILVALLNLIVRLMP